MSTEEFLIQVNGEPLRVPAGATLSALLEIMRISGDRVAVELDRNIVKRSDWASTPLREGAKVEIVQFVGGGQAAAPAC